MKQLLALTALTLMTTSAFAGIKVIYGRDNRQDIYQVRNSLHKKLAESTAGMINVRHFAKSSKKNFFDLQGTTTLERGQNICPSEAFSQQVIAPTCSGFLVGPDTLVTAGHCYKSFDTPENVCKNFAWVFGFDMKSSHHNPTRDIPLQNIYLCKKVVAAELSASTDFAIIKLDRAVVGRQPLKFRSSGRISSKASLVVIGHPTGLPLKVSPGGRVTRNYEQTKFSTTLDTFHGNSGSAVFDERTGVIEGILIQGKNDYMPSNKNDPRSCLVVNKCDENGNNCEAGQDQGPVQWGEVVLRIETIASQINAANRMKAE
ncbi:MAG: trypsin-like serine peptidase [Bacteriovoracia bacterium]